MQEGQTSSGTTSHSKIKKINGVNLGLGTGPLHPGKVIVHNGLEWRMTPEACLRGEHDGCIWRAICRWRAMGCGQYIDDDDAMQTCRISIAGYIWGYRQDLGAPSTFLCNYAFYTLSKMQTHAPQVERPATHSKSVGLVEIDALEDEHGAAIAHWRTGLVHGSDEDKIIGAIDAARIIGCWGGLSDRERYIVERRVVDEAGLAEIGREIGVSRERARQIYVAAMDVVKSAATAKTGRESPPAPQRGRNAGRRRGGRMTLRERFTRYHVVHPRDVTIESLRRAYHAAHTTVWRSVHDYGEQCGGVEERRVNRLGKSSMCVLDVYSYISWEDGRGCSERR